MEARTKTIEEWFSTIRQGLVALPRFQRFEAWDRGRIEGVLENVLREPSLPIGALLVLEVGDKEPFHSREIVGAPPKSDRPSVHLLDGQQRMTALWRSLTDNYDDLVLFVSAGDEVRPDVQLYRRWERKGIPQPVWAHDPQQVYERGLIPISLLMPGSKGELKAENWCEEVGAERAFERALLKFRQRVANYKIPFLALPVGTEQETALDVFINMNTSAAPLKDFDIVVAQLEGAVGDSLHDMMSELHQSTPALREFHKNEDLALSVGALLLGQPPLKRSYLDTSFGKGLAEVWPKVVQGIERGISFLHDEAIFGDQFAPTDVAVYLVCALWAGIDVDGTDTEGRARSIIRKALWRASFTDRYLKTAATRAYADHRRLAEQIANRNSSDLPELFDEDENPLPTTEQLMRAGWPTKRDRLARAIVGVSLRAGGYDFADGAKASAENVFKREYHHIFPVATLSGDRADIRVAKALNCALVSWKTNRKIAANTPADYLRARALDAHLGEDEVRLRLNSHLIPYDQLVAGDYEVFLDARAALIEGAMRRLCNGWASLD
ncbi:MAG: DUF262 domain-containing protein [Rhizobiaceae bacterium]|nr:DUF262 domain-containing protein [Rhizobiaceae bacterium]